MVDYVLFHEISHVFFLLEISKKKNFIPLKEREVVEAAFDLPV